MKNKAIDVFRALFLTFGVPLIAAAYCFVKMVLWVLVFAIIALAGAATLTLLSPLIGYNWAGVLAIVIIFIFLWVTGKVALEKDLVP